jgi:hypothetical protein
MEYASALVKLKPGSEDKLEEWRSTIASRLDEVAATLKDEEVRVESYFTIKIGGEKYLLWYLRAKSIERVFEISRQLKHPIDKFHYEVMTAISDAVILAKPLIDIPRQSDACEDSWSARGQGLSRAGANPDVFEWKTGLTRPRQQLRFAYWAWNGTSKRHINFKPFFARSQSQPVQARRLP